MRQLNRRLQLLLPEGEEYQRTGPAQQREPAPVAETGQRQYAYVQHQHVGQKQSLVRELFLQQQGRGEPAEDGQHGDAHRFMAQGQQRPGQGDDGESAKGKLGGNQAVERESAIDGKVQDGDSAAGHGLRPDAKPPPEVFARADERQPPGHSENHPLGLAQPAPVYGQADEEGDAENYRHDSDASQPVAAQQPLPVPIGENPGGLSGRPSAAFVLRRRGFRDGRRWPAPCLP